MIPDCPGLLGPGERPTTRQARQGFAGGALDIDMRAARQPTPLMHESHTEGQQTRVERRVEEDYVERLRRAAEELHGILLQHLTPRGTPLREERADLTG